MTGISFGRKKTGAGGAKRVRIAEPFLFTLGVLFVILYLTGLLYTAGGGDRETKMPEAAAVFADSEAHGGKRDKNVWDLFDDCLAEAFSRGDGGE